MRAPTPAPASTTRVLTTVRHITMIVTDADLDVSERYLSLAFLPSTYEHHGCYCLMLMVSGADGAIARVVMLTSVERKMMTTTSGDVDDT